jgi:oligopeptide/dipeptide ABC transporter ATP-binding protein
VILSQALLEVKGLKKYFGIVKAVDDVSFEIRKGETFGLVGESGCGKTTLGRTILKLIEPTDGEVYINTSLNENEPSRKHDITSTKQLRKLRRKMQIVFQDPASSLNPRMIINNIIAEPLKQHKIAKDKDLHDRVKSLVKKVGLEEEHLWRYPYELSGGQRQRVAIARAIVLNPDLVVLDEPTSALDVSVQAKILKLLKNLQKEMGLTYLFITHDMSVIDYMCDRVAVMYVGKIVENTRKEHLFTHPLHPYTKALLSSVPSTDPTKRTLPYTEIIPGEVASPIDPPAGCRFHPRCKYAFKDCGFGPRDFNTYFSENIGEKMGLAQPTIVNDYLEIKTSKEDIAEINKIISERVTTGKIEKEPIFESIKEIEMKENTIVINFKPTKEPDLIEYETGHYVRCLLYNRDDELEIDVRQTKMREV